MFTRSPEVRRSGELVVDDVAVGNEGEFATVLDAARRGQDWAVAVIFGDLHPALSAFLRGREPRHADDLEGEVWLAIAERIPAFDGDQRAFRSWVFTIARRRVADHRRTSIRRRTDPAPPESLDRPDRCDPEHVVLENLSTIEATDFVARTLPDDQAEVVLLRVVGGFEVAEVAEMVSKRPGTVRVLQHRALRRLARALEETPVTH